MVAIEQGAQIIRGARLTDPAGRMIVRDRVLTRVDVAKLAQQAEAARERLESANAQTRALCERLAEVVDTYCPGLAAERDPVRRSLCDAV